MLIYRVGVRYLDDEGCRRTPGPVEMMSRDSAQIGHALRHLQERRGVNKTCLGNAQILALGQRELLSSKGQERERGAKHQPGCAETVPHGASFHRPKQNGGEHGESEEKNAHEMQSKKGAN